MTKMNYESNLVGVCEKLEAVCRKVWDEDRVSAVALQAVSNELTEGWRRAEECIAALRQELQTRESVIAHECELKLGAMQKTLEAAKASAASGEEALQNAKARIETLRGDLEKKNEENAAAKERYLTLEAQKDSERSARMEKFIEEEDAKERERENFWQKCHQTLNTDLKKHESEFEKQRRELLEELQRTAEETRKLYLQKELELMEAQKQLQAEFQAREANMHKREHEYALKYEELEKLKHNLRSEIADLTRQYQPKAKDATGTK